MANVEIYTKETCPYCHRAKALLSSKGVSFQELPIDGNAAKREEMIKRSGRTTVPQIFIDAQHIGGCDDLYALDARGGLDPAEITCERWHYIAQYLRTTLKGFLHMSEQNNTEMTFQINVFIPRIFLSKRRTRRTFSRKIGSQKLNLIPIRHLLNWQMTFTKWYCVLP